VNGEAPLEASGDPHRNRRAAWAAAAALALLAIVTGIATGGARTSGAGPTQPPRTAGGLVVGVPSAQGVSGSSDRPAAPLDDPNARLAVANPVAPNHALEPDPTVEPSGAEAGANSESAAVVAAPPPASHSRSSSGRPRIRTGRPAAPGQPYHRWTD
jgi:hypothetical protein